MDGQPKRITKNLTQTSPNRPLCTKTKNIYRNFVFREILNEVRPVELRGEAFPTLFFHIVVGGFHESGNSV